MIFGFDFDNTLINYDKIFCTLAEAKKLIRKKSKKNKISIKKKLFKEKKLREWKELQSEVYSHGINKSKPNRELILILKFLKRKKIKYYIVSHKTKFPYYGEKINLHKISKDWLDNYIFNKKNDLGNCQYYFEPTIKKKIKRIRKLKITHFIDDLKEVIDLMPHKVVGILYRKNRTKLSQIKSLVSKQL